MLLHISTYSAIYLSVFLIWSLVDMSLSWRSRLCVRGRLTWSAAPPCLSGTRLFHGARSASSMEDIIAKNMQEEGIDPRATILLCVSAGSDSMAMLHLLQAVKQRLFQQLDLHVVNFNHKARKESDEEVCSICTLLIDCIDVLTAMVCTGSVCRSVVQSVPPSIPHPRVSHGGKKQQICIPRSCKKMASSRMSKYFEEY